MAATIRAIKAKLPNASVEVLTPDFLGVEEDALHTVLAARPEVFNHNIETSPRLHRSMRGAKASYDKALWLLRRAKELADYPVLTKSGIIVGLGETNDEIVETMRDLRARAVDVVTIGQYLQPSPKHAAIDRWVHPDEFRWLREQGEALGFGSSSPVHSCARATGRTSSGTQPKQAAAPSPTSPYGNPPFAGCIGDCHLASCVQKEEEMRATAAVGFLLVLVLALPAFGAQPAAVRVAGAPLDQSRGGAGSRFRLA